MATSVPPHNLGEVTEALVALIDDAKLETKDLLKYIKGPDFPTGGVDHEHQGRDAPRSTRTGQGAIKVRGEWKPEEDEEGWAARRSSPASRTR